MPGYFLHSGILFRQAKAAFERSAAAASENAPNQDGALVAILFSAATLEAWIAEMVHMAPTMCIKPNPHIKAFVDVMSEAEESGVSIRLKYLLAKSLLGGEGYNKGANPYQDFHLLFSVRNALVHMRPERIHPDVIAKCLNLEEIPEERASDKSLTKKFVDALDLRGLCVPKEPKITSSWVSRIQTRAVARWSCNVVVDMVKSICDALRPHVGDTVIDVVMRSFQRV